MPGSTQLSFCGSWWQQQWKRYLAMTNIFCNRKLISIISIHYHFVSSFEWWVGFRSGNDLAFNDGKLIPHYSDVTGVQGYLKSLVTWLFVQQLMRANSKETFKTCITGSLFLESTSNQWIPLTKGWYCRKCVYVMVPSWLVYDWRN